MRCLRSYFSFYCLFSPHFWQVNFCALNNCFYTVIQSEKDFISEVVINKKAKYQGPAFKFHEDIIVHSKNKSKFERRLKA